MNPRTVVKCRCCKLFLDVTTLDSQTTKLGESHLIAVPSTCPRCGYYAISAPTEERPKRSATWDVLFLEHSLASLAFKKGLMAIDLGRY